MKFALARSMPVRLRIHERKSAMNPNSLRTTFATIALLLPAMFVIQTRSAQSSSATTSQAIANSLLLKKGEGEHQIRHDLAYCALAFRHLNALDCETPRRPQAFPISLPKEI